MLGFPFQHQLNPCLATAAGCKCGHMSWVQASTGQQNALIEGSFYWHKNSQPRPCSTSGVRKIGVYVLQMTCRDPPCERVLKMEWMEELGVFCLSAPLPAVPAALALNPIGYQPFFWGLYLGINALGLLDICGTRSIQQRSAHSNPQGD